MRHLWGKDEGQNPTGSFKARGLGMAITRARTLGARGFMIPSAGNAGGAAAVYAARCGLPCAVIVPRGTPPAAIAEAAIGGAKVFTIEGSIATAGKVVGRAAPDIGWFDLSTLKEPYRLEGKKTMGLELAEQLDWTMPDVLLYPTGGGTGLVGIPKGYEELRAMGWVSGALPRFFAIQAEGCAPMVTAFHSGAENTTPWENPTTHAATVRRPSDAAYPARDQGRGGGGERAGHDRGPASAGATGRHLDLTRGSGARCRAGSTQGERTGRRGHAGRDHAHRRRHQIRAAGAPHADRFDGRRRRDPRPGAGGARGLTGSSFDGSIGPTSAPLQEVGSMAIDIGKIRNVGVVGHGGVGKTSLVESMLFAAGAVNRLGKVDDGSTTTDFDPDEIKRKISINTTVAYCDYKGHRINLVDTPGYGDLIADARAGLRVVEAAVVVVDAVAGVQVQTEKVWKFASEFDLPRAIVVNRLDRERADFFRTLDSLSRRLKGRIVPVHVPVGEESGFRGYVDLVSQKAIVFTDGKGSESAIPTELADTVKEWREKLVEAAAETDDDLLAKYLEEGSLAEPEMLTALRTGIAQGKIVPVLCAAATRSIGSLALLDLIIHEFPSPADRGEVSGTDLKSKQAGVRNPDPKAPVTALVFKTLSDPHIGKLSVFRVCSGTLRADSTLLNPARGGRERMGHIAYLMGKNQKTVEALGPGEIGVVPKLKDTQTGDTLCEEAQPFELPRITFPEPAINFAIQPKTRGDEDKISSALARIAEEDPTVHHHFDPETKQLLISGVGSMHVEMVVERMKRKYNVDVLLLPPRIPYKETVKGRAEGQGKYKKQTGGRGQYGDTWLRVEPLARGGGFEFADEIFGGAVPRNFIPSVEKGVRDCLKKGIMAGFPVVDTKVTLYDGSYHDVDSSDMAFQIAASMGLQKVFMEAHPILLEPIMNVEVTTPAEVAGDIIGDLNSRRGRIVGMEPAGETAVVRASAPMSEMLTYESSLRSMTGGRGGYSMEFSHYEEVPSFIAEKVVKEAKAEKEKAEKH
jgi:elongation factor G